MLNKLIVSLILSLSLYAGNLERNHDYEKKVYNIIQDGMTVGYAMVYSKNGYVRVSVINTTGKNKKVTVKCENDNSSSRKRVNVGSLVKKGSMLFADKAEEFKLTRSLCGYGAIHIKFQ